MPDSRSPLLFEPFSHAAGGGIEYASQRATGGFAAASTLSISLQAIILYTTICRVLCSCGNHEYQSRTRPTDRSARTYTFNGLDFEFPD